VAVSIHGEVILLDCGEGVQRQLARAGIRLGRITKAIITHMHGDHILGLLGLLQTFSMLEREKPFHIYGPRGINSFVSWNLRLLKLNLTYEVEVKNMREGIFIEEPKYTISALRGRHTAPSYAILIREKDRPGVFDPKKAQSLDIPKGELWKKLQLGEAVVVGGRVIRPEEVLGQKRRGRAIGYSGDTRPFDWLSEFFKGVDVLVFDSTYSDRLRDVAVRNYHSTAGEAGEVAMKAGAGMLILTHFSQRYEDAEELVRDAMKYHSNVVAASDFMVIQVPYPERGVPIAVRRLGTV